MSNSVIDTHLDLLRKIGTSARQQIQAKPGWTAKQKSTVRGMIDAYVRMREAGEDHNQARTHTVARSAACPQAKAGFVEVINAACAKHAR